MKLAEGSSLASILVPSITGMAFAAGWWLVVLGLAKNFAQKDGFSFFLVLFPLLSTAGLALMTTISRSVIISSDDLFSQGTPFQKMALFGFIFLVFVGCGASIALFFTNHRNTAMETNAMLLPIGTAVIGLR